MTSMVVIAVIGPGKTATIAFSARNERIFNGRDH